MEKRSAVTNGEVEIYLPHLFGVMLRKAWLMILAGVLGGILMFLGTYFFETPQYTSTAMFYVNNSAIHASDFSLSGVSYSDMSASQKLVYTYVTILKTRESVDAIVEYAGVDRSYEEVRDMISASPVDDTEIFRVVVTSPDPVEAKELAVAIAHVLPKRIATVVEGSSAEVVESAVIAVSRSSPDYNKSAKVGFVAGALVSAMVIATAYALDMVIRSEDDITRYFTQNVLASIPDMTASSSGGYYVYGMIKDRKPGKKQPPQLVGGKISFAAAEAYKLLRTKLEFSFPDEQGCHIIGVTSANAGEGKSTTAANLAYSMAALGKRVVLVDCDMRRPSLGDKLSVRRTPGLSEFLSAQIRGDELIQHCGLRDAPESFRVIAAGRTPPNPMELLGSARMAKLLEILKEKYDQIILDLPPVGEVGDALTAAKLADGMLVVVRQDKSDRRELDAAIRQLQFVDSRILGLVLTCAESHGGNYRKMYYRREKNTGHPKKGILFQKQSEN